MPDPLDDTLLDQEIDLAAERPAAFAAAGRGGTGLALGIAAVALLCAGGIAGVRTYVEQAEAATVALAPEVEPSTWSEVPTIPEAVGSVAEPEREAVQPAIEADPEPVVTPTQPAVELVAANVAKPPQPSQAARPSQPSQPSRVEPVAQPVAGPVKESVTEPAREELAVDWSGLPRLGVGEAESEAELESESESEVESESEPEAEVGFGAVEPESESDESDPTPEPDPTSWPASEAAADETVGDRALDRP